MSSVTGEVNPAIQVLAAPHFVEAPVHSGQRAVGLLPAFDRWVQATDSKVRMALSHRCHALFADRIGDAHERFRAAIELHRDSGAVWNFARPGSPCRVRPRPPSSGLTAQQSEIARLGAQGATNREIGEQLHISHRTVDHHLRNIFNTLGLRSRVEQTKLMR